jgi:4-hydroxy-tetrahydrodipicolinate reductase
VTTSERSGAAALRVAIIGDGKMGRAIDVLARERGIVVTKVLGVAENDGGRGISREGLGNPDVAIEFTEPEAAPTNILACARARVPVVVGTTGWLGVLDRVSGEVRTAGGAMLWAANFSIGVNLFFAIAGAAARAMRGQPFGAHIIETHHAAKKDAPSGTALVVEQRVAGELGTPVPIASVRVGHVPGTHEVVFDGAFEQIRLVHEARDRRVFADGALRAAAWLRGRTGIFTMHDVLGLSEQGEPGA